MLPVLQVYAQDWRGSVLWKLEKSGLATSYVMGTMHVASPAVLKWLPRVKNQLCASRLLYTEIPFGEMNDYVASPERLSGMMNQSGTPWLQQLSVSERKVLLAHFAAQMTASRQLPPYASTGHELAAMLEPMVSAMQPWMVAISLSMPENSTGDAIDLRLEQTARACGVTTKGIETLDEQLNIFIKLPFADQIDMVRSTLRQLQDDADLLIRMEQLYVAGELTQLANETEQLMKKETNPRLRRLDEELIDQRNKRMFQRVLGNVTVGKVFVAVGAMHLVGETGLLSQFERAGWRVTPVTESAKLNIHTHGQRASASLEFASISTRE